MNGPGRAPVVAVLGASGFLGGAVLRALATRPVRVRAVSRRAVALPPRARSGPGEVTGVAADLTDDRAVAEAVRGVDAIVVTVAQVTGARTWRVEEGDRAAERVNTGIAAAVAGALTEQPRRGDAPPVVVFAGSTTQAGAHPGPLRGTEPDRPVTAYDRQKLAAEQALLAAGYRGRCRAISLRLTTVFGPPATPTATDKGVVSTMARRALQGQPLTLWHDGDISRDLLYVDDAAGAFLAALRAADRLAGRAWMVGTGHSTPLRTVMSTVAAEAAGCTGGPVVPVHRVPAPAYASPLDLCSVRIDPAPFARASGWAAQTGWHQAVRHTVSALHHRPPADAEHRRHRDDPRGQPAHRRQGVR